MASEAIIRLRMEILVNWIPSDGRFLFDMDDEVVTDFAQWVVDHFVRVT